MEIVIALLFSLLAQPWAVCRAIALRPTAELARMLATISRQLRRRLLFQCKIPIESALPPNGHRRERSHFD